MNVESSVSVPEIVFPTLHVICTEVEAESEGFSGLASRLQEAGGPKLAIHLRLHGLSDRRLFELARELSAGSRATGGWCVINDRPDIGLAVRADAVQLGGRALPVAAVRMWLGGGLRIGASVHSPAAALAASEAGANYVLLGTIHATPSHPGRRGTGPGLISETRRALTEEGRDHVPIVAIGGIDLERVARVRAAGAAAIAVRRAVWSARDPIGAVQQLVDRFRAGSTVYGA